MNCIKEYSKSVILNDAEIVYNHTKDIWNEDREFVMAFYLKTDNSIICRKIVSIGTLNASLIHPREIFKDAIIRSANSIIVAHNHPGGGLKASNEDMQVTNKLVESGKLLGINVLDHVIVSKSGFHSMRESSEMEVS